MDSIPKFRTGDRVHRGEDGAGGRVGQILNQEDAPLEVVWDADGSSDWFKIDGRMWEEDARPTVFPDEPDAQPNPRPKRWFRLWHWLWPRAQLRQRSKK